MAAVTLVVVRLDIGSVGVVRAINDIVEADDLRVVGLVVVIQVVEPGVVSIDSGVDDGHHRAGPCVASIIPHIGDSVNFIDIVHLNCEDSVYFDQNDSWQVCEVADFRNLDRAGN